MPLTDEITTISKYLERTELLSLKMSELLLKSVKLWKLWKYMRWPWGESIKMPQIHGLFNTKTSPIVGGWATHLKDMLFKLDHSPK